MLKKVLSESGLVEFFNTLKHFLSKEMLGMCQLFMHLL